MKKYFIVLPAVLMAGVVGIGFYFSDSSAYAQADTANERHAPVCGSEKPGEARCHARVIVDERGKPKTTSGAAAYLPGQLRSAYNLTGAGSPSQIIAIVDAYNDPNIESDLAVYSARSSIPSLPSCGATAIKDSVVSCFQKVNQRGGTDSYPATDSGWALEISLDVEIAHGICPGCSILLVEADSSSLSDLFTAVDKAALLGAKEISNSYGTSREFLGETTYDSHFDKNGVAITVSSGDAGYGTSYPAVSPRVTSVGGTSLYLNADNSWKNEAAWSGSGSGCSSQEILKPALQPKIGTCKNRIIADVSAVADPNTGAAIYDSVPYNGSSGWFKVGGTSLSSPLIAAVYALGGGVSSSAYGNEIPYAHYSGNVHDITSGGNGRCGGNTALCTAVTGFDGPTGLGTPKGLGAF